MQKRRRRSFCEFLKEIGTRLTDNVHLDVVMVSGYGERLLGDGTVDMSSFSSGIPGGDFETPLDWQLLISQAKDGCDDSFQEMVERVYSYLILIAGARMRTGLQGKFGASDIVQHGLSKAHVSLDQFRGSSEAEFRSWVKMIVVNSMNNHNRHFEVQKREAGREATYDSGVISPNKSELPTQIDLAVRNEEKLLLQRYLARLPALEQRAIEMRHRFGYQHAEIATILGISEARVRSCIDKGIDQLKRWFKENEGLLDSTEISFE